MVLDLETLSFSYRKPLKTMGVACVHLDNVIRVKAINFQLRKQL